MTLLSTVLAFFPALVLAMTAASFWGLCVAPGLWTGGAFLFTLYGFPLLVYRLHQWRYPVTEGVSYLRGTTYSPWWGSHQIQVIYIAIPLLETVLRLIPGAFSLWLRLWGSTVGQGVYWTPRLEVSDRGLLEIGDRAVLGHGIGLYCHAIKPKRGDLMLYVKRIKIGRDAFLGGGCRLAPGVVVPDAAYIPVATDLYPHQEVQGCGP